MQTYPDIFLVTDLDVSHNRRHMLETMEAGNPIRPHHLCVGWWVRPDPESVPSGPFIDRDDAVRYADGMVH